MKKTITALFLSVMALPSYAALHDGSQCSFGNVSIPCEGNSWLFGIDGLYLKNRVNIYSRDTPNYEANYGLGTRLEGAYLYGKGHDMTVNWTNASRSKEKNFDVIIDGKTFVTATTKLDSHLNLYNFEFGQHINIADHADIRVHGGIEYTRLNSDPEVSIDTIVGIQIDAQYLVRGFGPRVGLDLDYTAGSGFGVFLHSSLALLYGSATTSGIVTFDDDGTERTIGATGKEYRTIPATEIRTGIKFTHQFSYGDLIVRGGYQTHNFINVRSGTNNLSWDGGFLGFSWLGFA